MTILTQETNCRRAALCFFRLLFVAVLAIVSSCEHRGGDEMGNVRKVYSYDNTLSCISADGDSYWIGTEDGCIWHVKGAERKFFATTLGRVYDVLRDSADNRLIWTGSRNDGVQLWHIDGDSLVHERTYAIAGKGSKYSAYDLQCVRGRIYAATSQGLFVVPQKGDTAEAMIPVYVVNGKKPALPNPINHIASRHDRWLYAAVGNGLLCYDIQKKRSRIISQKQKANYVTVYDDTLYVLTKGALLKEDVEGHLLKKTDIDFHARAFYKFGNVNMFLTSKSVFMSYDLVHFRRLGFWSGINAGAYNLMLPDDGHGFAVVLAGSDECHLPHHFNVEGHGAGQQLVAKDGSTLYFIDEQGYVYRAKYGEKRARVLTQLPDNHRPVMVAALDDAIYYVTADRNLYRLKLYSVTTLNQLFAHPVQLMQLTTHATAIQALKDKKTILLGVQDDLISIDAASGAKKIVSALHGKYITDFFIPQGSNDLYISTLNDGVFFYSDGAFKPVPGSAALSQIQGVSMYGSYDPHLFILTNHKLLCYGGGSIATHGDKYLLYANDSVVYTLPSMGLHKYVYRNGHFVDRGVMYADINFMPQASLALSKQLFLGSELGTAVLTPGNEGSLEWVTFNKTRISLWYLLCVVLVVVVAVLQFVIIRRNRNHGNMKQLALQVEDLNKRISGLKLMEGYLTEQQAHWLDDIVKRLSAVDVNTKKWRNAYETLTQLSSEVMRLNRDTVLQLVKALEGQLKEIGALKCYDSEQLIEASTKVEESGAVTAISQQFVDNKQWLDRVKEVMAKYRHYESELSGALRLKGVDEEIMDAIGGWRKKLYKEPLDEVESDVKAMDKLYDYIYSDEAMRLITEYMDSREQYLSKRKTYAFVAANILEQLKGIHDKVEQTDRTELLRELNAVELQVQQISTLHHLRKCMRAFADETDTSKENVAEIGRYIDRFFALFKQADPEVVNDILHFPSSDNQQVKVLVLLIADRKVKRTMLPGMLGLYGNLNPVVSRLYHGKIGQNLEKLNNYYAKHPASLTYYIIQLLKA